MHILFLTDNFYPELNAPASRTYDHCQTWSKLGHKVTVITCVPNFPTGRVFDGYKNKIYQVEYYGDIKVIRVWSFIAKNSGNLLRIIDFLSFMISSFFAGLLVKKPDLIIGTSPQFFTVCSAFALSLVRRKKWVFELRDLWPESIVEVGAMRESIAIKILKKIEYFLYKKANLIVSVTHSFKNILVSNGIPGEKIEVITNGVDLDFFNQGLAKKSDLRSLTASTNCMLIGYFGTIGMAHRLETILLSAQIIQNEDFPIKFVFVGEGAEKDKLIELAQRLDLKNVSFIAGVKKQVLRNYWMDVDLSITHLRRSELFESVIPSKIFESAAMGTPILHGVPGESADLVEKYGLGLNFGSEKPEELVEKIKYLYQNPDIKRDLQKNCENSSRNFSRKQLAIKMMEFMNNE